MALLSSIIFATFVLFSMSDAYAADIELLSQQPVSTQIIGNCYAYSSTDFFSAAYLKVFGGSSVTAPDALLLNGIVRGENGAARLTAGDSCSFIDQVQKVAPRVCSAEAFARYVAAKRSGATPKSLSEDLNLLDQAMYGLDASLNKSTWTKEDNSDAKKMAGQIIESLCKLGGVVSVKSPQMIELLDNTREIIHTLNQRSELLLRSPSQWFQSAKQFVGNALRESFREGFGNYLIRRGHSSLLNIFKYATVDGERKGAANEILQQVYHDMNQSCLSYARQNHLPMVPENFFAPAARMSCKTDDFFKSKLSPQQIHQKLNRVANLLDLHIATPIGVCSDVFYAKYPTLKGYREEDGTCHDGGPHAVTITGKKMIDGKRYFLVRNTWGADSCSSLQIGRRMCQQTALKSGCPLADKIDCKDGIYTMSEDYLSKLIIIIGEVSYKGSK